MGSSLKSTLRSAVDYLQLPGSAKSEMRRDKRGLPVETPSRADAITAATDWLAQAQDNSASRDGGVARHYSLISGWSTSYPETTGYIIPTILDRARATGNDDLRLRARRMLDWLVAIQLPDGGFQGGLIDSRPVVPVTFNTGQILLGLARGTAEFGDTYRESLCRAADWLVQTQDPDGCWRSQPTPFAAPGEKAYETHVAWGLLEAARIEPGRGYTQAALANVNWALRYQKPNGWFDKCCLVDPTRPLTHTLGYILRGLVEAYRFFQDASILQACCKTADGLLKAIRLSDGFLPGRLDENWSPAVNWACLTGSVQIAWCWMALAEITGETRYLEAAFSANRFVRRTVRIEGPAETRGAVKGSFPVNGAYGRFEYLNWACKFFIDAQVMEEKFRDGLENERTIASGSHN